MSSRLDVVARALPPPPPLAITVSGRAWLDGHVLKDRPVQVGAHTVITDAEGRFHARLSAVGRIRVRVDPTLGRRRGRTPCLFGAAEEIEVEPTRTRYWVTVRERTARRSHCEGE